MASHLSAIKCPCCGRSAFEDYYYKTGEKYIACIRCGYNYTKTVEGMKDHQPLYKETEYIGYGMLSLVKKDGSRKRYLLNDDPKDEDMQKYKQMYLENEVNQDASHLVINHDGQFTVVLGTPSENFHLPFEEYKGKMFKKYGEDEFSDVLVPIEE
jgi:hypothetical protein